MSDQDINRHIDDLLRPSGPVNETTRAWFSSGLLMFFCTDNDLQHCLGIERDKLRRSFRDGHLVNAWLSMGQELKPWPRCQALVKEINSFQTRVWRDVKDLPKPDPTWSKFRQELFMAFQYKGVKDMPGDRQLSNIMKSWGVYVSVKQEDICR